MSRPSAAVNGRDIGLLLDPDSLRLLTFLVAVHA
jgi:hypothetical protein